MADPIDTPDAAASAPPGAEVKEKIERREIKGGLPYTVAAGVFKKALDQIIVAERPDKVTYNFISTVLRLSGGAAKAVPPLLKKMSFIGADASPTLLYSKFKTDGGRSQAAFDGLRQAFSELFRRNEFIHKADEASVKDVIVEITGLKKSDNIVRAIYSTFDVIRSFISTDVSQSQESQFDAIDVGVLGSQSEEATQQPVREAIRPTGSPMALHYNINIVLPETENVAVLNAIFRSLRDNLLRQ